MDEKSYHKDVPEEMRLSLRLQFAYATNFEEFLNVVDSLSEPIGSAIRRPLAKLENQDFVHEGKPNWKVIRTFKRLYQIPGGLKLPITADTVLSESLISVMRTVVTRSSDYRALSESLPLIMTAVTNGYGNSPCYSVLYIFDVLTARR